MAYYGFQADPTQLYETEEERRARLAREQAEQPVKTTVVTNPDGTQEMTVKGTPQSLSAANPNTPTLTMPGQPVAGPVAPDQKPMTDDEYRRYIAQNESGARPDIGYHMPGKSSAYGTYGMTQAAYQDVQRVNPAFANRPINSLTPEEQNRAMDTYTQQNARYLQSYGVQPTQPNLALSHFLGAKGAADYLKTGYISPQAAAANGGEENVRRIAQQRLAMQPSPASGAAQPQPTAQVAAPAQPTAPVAPTAQSTAPVAPTAQPTAQVAAPARPAAPPVTAQPTAPVAPTAQPAATPPGVAVAPAQSTAFQDFIKSQKDPRALLGISEDTTGKYTETEKQLAKQQVYDLVRYQNESAQVQNQVKEAIKSNDARYLNKVLSERSEGVTPGNIAKAFLYSLIGFESGAKDVVNKMGIGATWQQQFDEDGKPVLVKMSADGIPLEGINSQNNKMNTDELVRFGGGGAASKFKPEVSGTAYVKKDAQGNVVMRGVRVTQTVNGQTRSYVESGGKRYDFNQGWEPESISTATAKATAQKQINLSWDPIIKAATTSAEALAQAGVKYGLNLGIAGTSATGQPIIIDKNTNQVLQPDAQGQITATQSAPAGQLPAGGTQALATGAAVSEAAQKQFVEKTVPAIVEEGTSGSSVANIRTQQINTIKDNPSILGIFNGRGTEYDRARKVISKLISGAYAAENSGEFYKELNSIGLSEPERAALENFGNLNMEINTKTLKANTGGGQISNAEQKINQQANLSNIAEQTPLATLQGLYRSQFTGNMNSYKQWYAANNPALNTDAKFAAAWQKEQALKSKAYTGIMDARAEFLKQYLPPKDATPQQLDQFRDRIFKAFEMYPAPTFDATTGKWSYVTANAEKAAAKKLLGQ